MTVGFRIGLAIWLSCAMPMLASAQDATGAAKSRHSRDNDAMARAKGSQKRAADQDAAERAMKARGGSRPKGDATSRAKRIRR